MVVVLSSPSGGGKTTIARRVLASRNDMEYSVSATTRAPRTGEIDGREYHFLSAAEFERKAVAGEFLEHAHYNGNRYGTLESEVGRINGGGNHVLLDIEIQGARLVRERFPDALLIFVIPPSGAVLAGRLRGRGTETDEVIDGRLRRAVEEIGAAGEYDYVVVNDDLDVAVTTVNAILDSEGLRPARDPGFGRRIEQLRQEVASEVGRTAATG